MKILNNFNKPSFLFSYFCERRFIDVLDPENQPGKSIGGSRAYKGRLTPHVLEQIRTLLILYNIFIKQNFFKSPSFEIQNPGSEFGQNPDPKPQLLTLFVVATTTTSNPEVSS